MGQLRLVVLFVTTVGLTSLMACSATRVQVASPPSDDAPIAERMAYYERHKLNITADEVTASAWFKSSPVQPVVLTNGARVEDHRDLLPLLEPESATAQSIADANATHTWMQMTGGVGAVMMGAAPLVFSIGLRDPPPLNPNAPSGGPSMETDVLASAVCASSQLDTDMNPGPGLADL